jgi:hypothetical protein
MISTQRDIKESFPAKQLRTIQEVPTTQKPNNETLVAKGWQRQQYIGIAILFFSVIAAVGFFSRRFEYALIFAFFLSLVLILFFLTA